MVNQNYEETIDRVDGLNSCLLAYTSVDEYDDGGVELSLFPNPMETSSTLQINNRYNAEIRVSLIDPTGKMVRDYGRVTTNQLEISKNTLSAGMYFVQIMDNNRILTREKLVVR